MLLYSRVVLCIYIQFHFFLPFKAYGYVHFYLQFILRMQHSLYFLMSHRIYAYTAGIVRVKLRTDELFKVILCKSYIY